MSVIECGVSQGSTIGPTLFLIYIIDLLKLSINGKILSYADNTCILYKHINIDALKVTMKNDLSKVDNWLKSNMLGLNNKKQITWCSII